MSLKLKTPPASLAALMLQDICDHLRRVAALDELPAIAPPDLSHIERMTEAAVAMLDGPVSKTRRALLTQTWTLFLDEFPATIVLPLSPVQSVASVKYYDVDGYKQTIGASKYVFADGASWDPRIAPATGEPWPTTENRPSAVEVEFVAGYGSAVSDVPAPLLQAIRLIVGDSYMNREAIAFSTPHELPLGVRELIQPYRIYR